MSDKKILNDEELDEVTGGQATKWLDTNYYVYEGDDLVNLQVNTMVTYFKVITTSFKMEKIGNGTVVTKYNPGTGEITVNVNGTNRTGKVGFDCNVGPAYQQ